MKCLQCSKEISDKAKFCSDAHRKAYGRKVKVGQTPDKNDPEVGQMIPRTTKSDTDQLFENWRPNYYVFGEEVFKKICVLCGKNFETQMTLLRFCSPECQKQVMVTIANGPHPNWKEGPQ